MGDILNDIGKEITYSLPLSLLFGGVEWIKRLSQLKEVTRHDFL
jgi:hypothetical protein